MERGRVLVERCPTGVPGFDELCNGGLIRNSVNAILGGPGAGKTIFLLQFLYNGATMYKENGLYISFEPDVLELYKDASTFGWNFQKLESENKCKFIRVSPQTELMELKQEVTAIISKHDIKRVCLDPISLFKVVESNSGKVRQMIFDLSSLLKRLNATVLLADETSVSDMEETGISGCDTRSQYVKFLVDGVIGLYSSGLGGVSDRAVRISKMRRTDHIRGPIPMQITNQGVKVIYGKSKK